MIERTYDLSGGSTDRVTGVDSLRTGSFSGTGFVKPAPQADPHDTPFGDATPNGPVAENIQGGALTSFSDAPFSPDLGQEDPHLTATTAGEE